MNQPWKGSNVNVSINADARKMIDEIHPHLKDEYNGPSHFFREKLREEKEEAATIEDKIDEFQKKKRIADERIEELRNLKEEKKRKKKARRLKNKLESKQERFEELKQNDLPSVEEKRSDLEDRLDRDEFADLIDEKVEEHKEKLNDRRDLDKLSKEIKDLQQEIRDIEELDSSPDWFVEVTA